MSTTPSEADKRASAFVVNALLPDASLKKFDEHASIASQIIADHHQPEREALVKSKKSIEGLVRLVEELKTAAGNVGTLNAITIGAYLGEAQAALAAIEKVAG